MEWNEFSFESDTDLVAHVEHQAGLALPAGWRLERIREEQFCWRMVPPGQPRNDILLRVSADRMELVFLHGNTDLGALGLHHVLLNAKVISVSMLSSFPLSGVIKHILVTCKPNEWGLT